MTTREQQVHDARQIISDGRLLAFFRAANRMQARGVFAVELIGDALDRGETLDAIFYDGEDFGYLLSAEQTSGSTYRIEFGCQAGPSAGDGGEWEVSFAGDEVLTVSGGWTWIS
jgi:hypothetical protein